MAGDSDTARDPAAPRRSGSAMEDALRRQLEESQRETQIANAQFQVFADFTRDFAPYLTRPPRRGRIVRLAARLRARLRRA